MNNSDNKSSSLIALITGIAIGAVGMFLYKKENRDIVKAKLHELKKRGNKELTKAQLKLEDKKQDTKKALAKKLNTAQKKLEE